MYYIDIKIDNFIKHIARRVVSWWDERMSHNSAQICDLSHYLIS